MKKRKSKSWAMAYCGMAAALCVALMLLGTIIPIAMFIAPAVASFLIATVCMECGITMAWTAYAAVSLLGLLFVPDKEIALIFTVLLGYYPLVKPRFDRIRPRALQLVCKLLLCNAAVLAMYGLLLVLVPAGSASGMFMLRRRGERGAGAPATAPAQWSRAPPAAARSPGSAAAPGCPRRRRCAAG